MLRMFAFKYAYLSPMGWSCIYSRCPTSWMVTRTRSHWLGYFLLLSIIFFVIIDIRFGNGYRKSSLFGIIFLPYWGIRFDDELLLLSFLIDEIWLDLQDNILYFSYLWETFHNRPLGQANWAFILGWHKKGLKVDVERAEGFNGQASPLGCGEWACVFRWARLFLGPGEWAGEPQFSNPIKLNISKLTCPLIFIIRFNLQVSNTCKCYHK